MDCWDDVKSPQQHLAKSKWILETCLPWEAERCTKIALTDDNGILTGSLTPVVRKPVATFPSGKQILGMADATVLNDPITGQGSNNAAKCADIYIRSIIEHGQRPADREWMEQTFDRYWSGYARWVTESTNTLLNPPPHVIKILDVAGKLPEVAEAVANGSMIRARFSPGSSTPRKRRRISNKPRSRRRKIRPPRFPSRPRPVRHRRNGGKHARAGRPPHRTDGEFFFIRVARSSAGALELVAAIVISGGFHEREPLRGQRAGGQPASSLAAVRHVPRRQVRRCRMRGRGGCPW